MGDSWDSIKSIADWVGDNQDVLQPAAGPGAWNDMDALIIGNYALSRTQMRAQMAIWSIAASPLFMGNDLRKLSSEAREILLNREVIEVNQQTTPAGLRIVHNTTFYANHDIWMRHMANDAIAVGVWNRCIFGTHLKYDLRWSDLGLDADTLMSVRNLWDHKDLGCIKAGYSLFVDPDDVVLLKLTPCSNEYVLMA